MSAEYVRRYYAVDFKRGDRSEGHASGRDYVGDGWNSDAHDPEADNPYREARP